MTASRLKFKIDALASNSQARAATFHTLHNPVQTPLFMPVGTQAAVKAQRPEALEDAGSQILLANTYHLLLRPGPEIFRDVGGYHKFTSWKRSVLTDSGGFQIFSLFDNLKMSEHGAAFRSHLDGKKFVLTPELSIDTQIAIGSDIMMVLDQCIPSTAGKEQALQALGITNRWAKRSLDARKESPQSLFAIVQGALFKDLRRQSADALTQLPFDGFAIGGLAVGESKEEREDICEFTTQLLPSDRPRYMMGVGTPLDILEAVHRGVDMFDCIIPTQVAQHGTVFTSRGILHMRRAIHNRSQDPLDPACHCPTCKRFSRAYLHHLLKAKEPLSWQLLGQHNIYFYHQLMREIRSSILEDRFGQLYQEKRQFLHVPDVDNPVVAVPKKKKRSLVLGDYRVLPNPAGFSNIQHIDSGEIMHSRNPPMEEANALYIGQSQLVERLQSAQDTPIVLWDVGLGAAANAMAAVQAYEGAAAKSSSPLPPLHIVSFENDLDSLRLALHNHSHFPYLWHQAPGTLLAKGHWQSPTLPGLQWTLLHGDFRKNITSTPAPSIVFFDMFSSKTNQEEWTLEAFSALFAACRESATELYTYSCSTAIRASLLSCGFYVAKGKSTGLKAETTIALTPLRVAQGAHHPLLGDAWLAKWQRSSAQVPSDLPAGERDSFCQSILRHPQFIG